MLPALRIPGAALVLLSLLTLSMPAHSQVKSGFEARLAETKAAPELTEATVVGTKTKVYLHKEAVLASGDVANARVEKDNANKPTIAIVLTEQGGTKLAKASAEHVGKPLALLVEGKVVMAPIVRTKIDGGRVMLTGDFTQDEAERIANAVKRR